MLFKQLDKSKEVSNHNFELTIWHHKLDEESLEDLQIEVRYRYSDDKEQHDYQEEVLNYVTIDAFKDIKSYDDCYKEGIVYKTTIVLRTTYYINYYGEVDYNQEVHIKSHEVVSTNVDKWYKENCY